MSNDLAMTMGELEAESAELLPSRETLCVSQVWRTAVATPPRSFPTATRLRAASSTCSFLNGDNVNILGIANQL